MVDGKEVLKREVKKEIDQIELEEKQEEFKKLGWFQKAKWKASKKRLKKRIEKLEKEKEDSIKLKERLYTALIELNEILVIVDDNEKELSNEDIIKLSTKEAFKLLKKAVIVMEEIEG